MFPQKLAVARLDQTNVSLVPLHVNATADPARWGAVIGCFNLDTAIQMNGALAVFVIAEWFKRKRNQHRFFFGEHCGNLPLCSAVNACIRPSLFQSIQIGLRFPQALEAQTF